MLFFISFLMVFCSSYLLASVFSPKDKDNKPSNFFHSGIDYPEGYLDKYYINMQESRLEE